MANASRFAQRPAYDGSMTRACGLVVIVIAMFVIDVATASAQAPGGPSTPPPPPSTSPDPSAPPAPTSPDPTAPTPAPTTTPPAPTTPPLVPMGAPPPANWGPPSNGYLVPPQPPSDLRPGDPGYRSPDMALALSLGLTLGGVGLNIWAQARVNNSVGDPSTATSVIGTVGSVLTLVGPTTGHIYAGRTWNPGLKWRLISVGVFTVTAVFFLSAAIGEHDGGGEGSTALLAIGVLASGITYLGATIYEISTAPRAAREHNHRGSGTTITIAPTLGRAPGLAVVGTF